MSGHKIHLKNYRIDKKTGKPVKSTKGKSVSQRIAEKKKTENQIQTREVT